MVLKLKAITAYLLICSFLFGLSPSYMNELYYATAFAESDTDEALLDMQNDTKATPTPNETDGNEKSNTEETESGNTKADTNESGQAELSKYTDLKKIELLTALKIVLPDEIGEPNEWVTRGQMSKILARIMNFKSEEYVEYTGKFKDVATDNALAPYIDFISSSGIINGDADGNFYPERNVTYTEAVKILVSLIGYRDIAEQKGGYPAGYLFVASDKKLNSGIVLAKTKEINRNTLYTMLYNAMQCDMLVRTDYGSITYKTVKGYTILEEYLNIKKYKGLLVDNGDTKLDEASQIQEDQIAVKMQGEDAINVFDSKSLDDKNMIGLNVEYYVKNDEIADEKEVIYIKTIDTENDVLTIDSQNITNYNNKIFTYKEDTDDATVKYAKIGELTDKLYNGIAYPNISDVEMVPTNGNIVLIDNNNDSVYDVVLVNDYTTIVVDNVNTENNTIRERYNLKSAYDYNTDDHIVRVKNSGEWSDFASIELRDVLTVAKSKIRIDQKYLVNIYISKEQVSGKLNEAIDDYDKVVIDDQEYDLTPEFKKTVVDHSLLSIGETYLFYMDMNGEIAAVKNDAVLDSRYVLLINAGKPSGLGAIQLKVFTSSKKVETLNVSSSCTLDGGKYSNDEILALLKRGQSSIPVQLVKLEKDSKNNVATIEMWKDLNINIVPNAQDEYPNIDPINSDKSKLFQNVSEVNLNYKKVTKSFDGYFSVDDSTMIFKVPTDVTSEKDYEFLTTKQLVEGTFDVKAYNVSDIGVAKAIVITKETWFLTPAYTDPIGIVDHVTKAFDEEKDEYVKKVYFYKSGMLTSITLPNDLALLPYGLTFEALNKGDIIRYSINPRTNKVWYLIRHFDIKKRDTTQIQEFGYTNLLSQDYDYSLRFVYGQPYSIRGSVVRLKVKGAKNAYFFDFSKASIYLFKMNSKNSEMLTGDINKLTDYTTTGDWIKTPNVFMKTIKGEVKEVVIYDFSN